MKMRNKLFYVYRVGVFTSNSHRVSFSIILMANFSSTSSIITAVRFSTLCKEINPLHPSFSTILKDKTKGGLLLNNVIYHISEQNKLGLPLFLTPKGIKASHALIDMLNLLPIDNSSNFKGSEGAEWFVFARGLGQIRKIKSRMNRGRDHGKT